MDIIYLFRVIWRKKWIWLIIPMLSGALAFLFTLNQIDLYKASTQLSTGFTINDQVQLTDERFNPRDADLKFSNLLSSMNSGAPVNFVSYRLLIHDLDSANPSFHKLDINGFRTSAEEIDYVLKVVSNRLETLTPLATSDPDYEIIRKFLTAYGYDFGSIKNGLTIKRVPNTDFIQVDFVSDNPELSALAANAFCEEFIRFNKSMKSERVGESVEFLEHLVTEKKKTLDEKLEVQQIFKSSNSLFSAERDGTGQLTQLSDLERQRDELRSSLYRIELTRERLNNQLAGNSQTTPTGDNQRIIELRNTINRLNERYITGGQTNNVLRDSISYLREQLRIETDNLGGISQPVVGMSRAEINSKLNELDVEYQVAKSNLSTVEAKIRNLQYSVSGYASKEAKLSAIQQEIDLASKEYLDAVAKFNEAKNRMLTSNTLRQVTAAFPPLNPINSKRILIIGLAVFASFSLCIFVIVFFEFIDQSIKSSEKFEAAVGLPLLGSVIKVTIKNFNIPQLFGQSGSEEAETFKSLLRKIRHEAVALNSPVLMLTSLRRNEGKTFMIIALAYALSLINKRILIIDTNFRSNLLSKILPKAPNKVKAIENRSSPAALLLPAAQSKNEAETDDTEMDYELINPSIFKNVFIVTNAGGGAASPAEILSGRNFTNLIQGFKENFDFILLEGAALNDFADTKELIPYVDKVITIFSAQTTINQQDRESIHYLKTLGDKFGGCILNRVDMKDMKL